MALKALEVLGAVIGVLFALAGAWAFWRGAGGTALQSLETSNRVLEKRVNSLSDENGKLRRKLSVLETRTDFIAATAPMEANAERRHDAVLTILTLIAERLGTDPNGH